MLQIRLNAVIIVPEIHATAFIEHLKTFRKVIFDFSIADQALKESLMKSMDPKQADDGSEGIKIIVTRIGKGPEILG